MKTNKLRTLKPFILLILKLTIILLSFNTIASDHVNFLAAVRDEMSNDPIIIIDKIERRLLKQTLNSQQELELQIELVRALNKMSSTDKSAINAEIIISKAENLNFPALVAEGKYQLATSYYLQGSCRKAIKIYNEAKIKFEQVKRIERVVDSMINVAACLTKNEDKLPILSQALTLAQQLDNKDILATVLNAIGISYFDLKKYDRAMSYFQKAINTLDRDKEPALFSSYFIDLSDSHLKSKDYTSALKALNSSLSYAKKSKSRIQISQVYFSFGHLYFAQTLYNDAMAAYKKALVLSIETNGKGLQAESLLAIAKILKQTDLIKAINMSNEALAIASSLDIHELTIDIHLFLVECYNQNNDYVNASRHTDLYNKLNENFILESVNNQVLQLSDTIESTQQSYEVEILRKDKALKVLKQQEKTNSYRLFSAVAILMLLFLLIYLHRKKK